LLLCYVGDRSLFAAAPARKILLKKIAAAAAAGVDWIQIREKDLSGKESSTLTREALKLARNADDAAGAGESTGSPRALACSPRPRRPLMARRKDSTGSAKSAKPSRCRSWPLAASRRTMPALAFPPEHPASPPSASSKTLETSPPWSKR